MCAQGASANVLAQLAEALFESGHNCTYFLRIGLPGSGVAYCQVTTGTSCTRAIATISLKHIKQICFAVKRLDGPLQVDLGLHAFLEVHWECCL